MRCLSLNIISEFQTLLRDAHLSLVSQSVTRHRVLQSVTMEPPGSPGHTHYTVTVSIDQNYLLALDSENTEACVVCGDRASGE